MNQKFQNAIRGVPQKTPPIWFMRQAGRYHKHYQALRAKHSFMDLCKVPELATEVALGPVEDFDFDVSILFSDLLFPLETLGMGLEYTDQGPRLGWHLTPENIRNLKTPAEALKGLEFQKEAVALTRKKLPSDKSLIGFVGGPWTLFVYAMEGGHAGSLTQAKSHLSLFNSFCEVMTPLLMENIQLQLQGGAEAVMVFDTAAGEVSPMIFQNYIQPQLEKIARSAPGKLGYYSKGTTTSHFSRQGEWNTDFSSLWIGMGFDHRFDLAYFLKKKNQVSPKGFVQGNFDQSLLFLPPQEFKTQLMKYLEPFQKLSESERAGWVSGLGHGVLPKTPEENVRTFVKTVREVFS
ncbi:MAG: uroporphyrinogen decarboxylase family protein [Bdellovibrionales bacterium]